ncbi:MAG: helix-turn-helix transcriptional regulator [Phycisphaerales bacterium]|nr:helix-turn-helix transcriptional regulator [Phycisphaerales bacterium]
MTPGIADQLRAAVRASGLTQAEIADRAGMHRPDVARFMSGARDPRASTIDRIARAVGVHIRAIPRRLK